ncbi:MAG: hypothetical protein JSV40_02930 [Deltaproteobacteria bacterium]|nr:MAG: hypothetical protein JSV40_02930 [Deltaproteobacteria bacterium]
MTITLQPPDIFLTRGTSLVSRAIRLFTRAIGESRTKVNHVGVIVIEGDLRTAVAVEAFTKVKRHKLWKQYGPPSSSEVAIYRATNLSEDEIETITKAAESYVGRTYGYLKLLAHLADWFLQGAYVFRRLARMDKYPICSWLVAHSFAKAGKYFGVPPGAASPDDIWDFIQSHLDIYTEIYPLGLLNGKSGT